MDKRIEVVLEELQRTLGLQHFVLHTHSISQEVSAFGGFDTLLHADWLPPAAALPEDEDFLPDGTVSIKYSLRFQQLLFAITQGQSSSALPIAANDDQFIHWVEQQTGLCIGETFVLTNHHEYGIEGTAVHKGIPIYTNAYLEVEWDSQGRLIMCHLPLVVSNEFEDESFTLTLESIEPLVRQQLTPIRLPIEDELRFADYYAIDEVFIAQDGSALPYFSEEQSATFPDVVLHWTPMPQFDFKKQLIQPFGPELSAKEAFDALQHPISGITDDMQLRSIQSATTFLSSVLLDETGQWTVYRIMQQPGMIEVVCLKIDGIAGPLRRKILIMLNKDTYEVMNFMDSSDMVQLFEGFTQPLIETISHEEAFEKMVSSITLDPRYVYHQLTRTYKLCGLLDSDEAVDAATGELKHLNDL